MALNVGKDRITVRRASTRRVLLYDLESVGHATLMTH